MRSLIIEMKEPDVFVVADNVLSAIGRTTAENFSKLKENISAVKQHADPAISPKSFLLRYLKKASNL